MRFVLLGMEVANVRDLTQPQGPLNGGRDPALAFTNLAGTNSFPAGTLIVGVVQTSFSPHSQTQEWGGVAGIFKQMTVQAGLN